jgi:mono/diheme cytochrome c family protein
MKKYLIYLSAALFIAACTKAVAPTATQPDFTEADVQRASTMWPNTTAEDLKQGKALYEANCGSCHGLKKPSSEPESEWRHIVPPMAKKAKIDADTEFKILRYVVTMCTVK